MKKISSKSRKTPWSDMPEATALQAFIDESNQDNYHRKHPAISDTGEVELLNSLEVKECRHCRSSVIQRFGFTPNGVRRFRCKDCGRTFNALTNTIFDSLLVSRNILVSGGADKKLLSCHLKTSYR
ncbi:hypothetical protein [uncultured Sphaerochaeta sp.]|uniref:IS1/IS1595 family N-terminal zinc-binding domain-containing protein n=1 Tax=uncultured Sphaerochaeta sp. TaxID=886478 RepID=UPI0029C9BFF0|nr:hypothetical protein [uncultured Sphaerochaeta sp.]